MIISSIVEILCNLNLKDPELKTYIASQTCTKSDKMNPNDFKQQVLTLRTFQITIKTFHREINSATKYNIKISSH